MAHFVGIANSEASAQGAVNCFSFDPIKGLTDGIELTINMQKRPESTEVYRPHVRCGGSFIATDNAYAPATKVVGDKTLVLSVGLRTVTPNSGRDSFTLLSAKNNSHDQFVRISTSLLSDSRVKQKLNTEHIRAWEGVLADDSVDKILVDESGACFLRFTKNEQEALVYVQNGEVYALLRQDNHMIVRPLTRSEMAQARVEQFEVQLSVLDNSEGAIKRKHGILGGAIRLLHLSKSDAKSREVLTNFLRRNIELMLGKMKEEVRIFLLSCNDHSAIFFGEYVVGLSDLSVKFKVGELKGPPADERKRKQARAERDRQAYLDRGSATGVKQKKHVSSKK